MKNSQNGKRDSEGKNSSKPRGFSASLDGFYRAISRNQPNLKLDATKGDLLRLSKTYSERIENYEMEISLIPNKDYDVMKTEILSEQKRHLRAIEREDKTILSNSLDIQSSRNLKSVLIQPEESGLTVCWNKTSSNNQTEIDFNSSYPQTPGHIGEKFRRYFSQNTTIVIYENYPLILWFVSFLILILIWSFSKMCCQDRRLSKKRKEVMGLLELERYSETGRSKTDSYGQNDTNGYRPPKIDGGLSIEINDERFQRFEKTISIDGVENRVRRISSIDPIEAFAVKVNFGGNDECLRSLNHLPMMSELQGRKDVFLDDSFANVFLELTEQQNPNQSRKESKIEFLGHTTGVQNDFCFQVPGPSGEPGLLRFSKNTKAGFVQISYETGNQVHVQSIPIDLNKQTNSIILHTDPNSANGIFANFENFLGEERSHISFKAQENFYNRSSESEKNVQMFLERKNTINSNGSIGEVSQDTKLEIYNSGY